MAATELVTVVDCGTDSIRAYIAELRGQKYQILDDLVVPVDLSCGFRQEHLDRDTMDQVLAGLSKIATAASSYNCERIRVVGTAAMRAANNGDVLCERVTTELNIDFEIINGGEEARLYNEALRSAMAAQGQRLQGVEIFVDIGGTNTTTCLLRNGSMVQAVDEHFGTRRVIDQFRNYEASLHYITTLGRMSYGAARMTLRRLGVKKVRQLYVTGAEVREILEMFVPDYKTSEGTISLPVSVLQNWMEEIEGLSRAQYLAKYPQDEAELWIPAAAHILHLAEETDCPVIQVPWLNLRDGLLADEIKLQKSKGRRLDRRVLVSEAKQLNQRFGIDKDYAENTASLALQIFEQTRSLHGLDDDAAALLEFATLTHDIGSYVNVRSRHKHSLYILQECELSGLNEVDQVIAANIARYHRQGAPESHHDNFTRLSREHRVLVSYLAAILRLAYALDVDRQQRIKRVTCQVHERRLLMRVDRRQIILEQWSVEDKKNLFVDVFGLDVVLLPLEEN